MDKHMKMLLELLAVWFIVWLCFAVISMSIDIHPALALGTGYIVGYIVGDKNALKNADS